MRILLLHPNYHWGGAEIAGRWPPAWAAYLAGALKSAGFEDLRFIDTMTNDLSEVQVREMLRAERPDIIGVTAITPSIYKAERLLQIAREEHPDAVTVLGGVHATFMYGQVLAEAPWIDVIVPGEGEQIIVDLARAVESGAWPGSRHEIRGIAFRGDGRVVATEAAPTGKDIDALEPDWGILEWGKYIYIPLNTQGCSTLWDSNESEQVVESGESGAVAVLAEGTGAGFSGHEDVCRATINLRIARSG